MVNKRIYSIFILTVFLTSICFLLYGCPKKTPPLDQGKTDISTGTSSRLGGETMRRPFDTSKTDAEREMSQIAALKGEDIPLGDVPHKEFGELTPEEKAVFKNIYFDFDKSNIKPRYREVLDEIGEWIKENVDRQLLIEGHCDERGTNEYNLALGERRALSVRRYLVGLGIHPEKLHTISYGEEKPAAYGHDSDAWAKNRRAEFKLSAQE